MAEKRRKYRLRKPDAVRAKTSAWKRAHPDICAALARSYRARLLGSGGTVTRDEWLDILEYFGHRCAYCLRHESTCGKLTQDHVVALSRGGEHTAENVVPACVPCNSTKRRRPVWVMLRGPSIVAALNGRAA